jgi:hypothetical protein
MKWLTASKIVGSGGLILEGWEFDHPFLSDPKLKEVRVSILDEVCGAIRDCLAESPAMLLESLEFGQMSISLFVGDVDDGHLQWDISVSDIMRLAAERLSWSDVTDSQKEEMALAFETMAARIRAGEYDDMEEV